MRTWVWVLAFAAIMVAFIGVIVVAAQYSTLAGLWTGLGGALPVTYLLKRLIDEFFYQLHREQDRRDKEQEREEEQARKEKDDKINALQGLENKVSLWITLIDKGHGNLKAEPLVEGAMTLSKALDEFKVEHHDLTDNQIMGYLQHLDSFLTWVYQFTPNRIMSPTDDFWSPVRNSRKPAKALKDALKKRREGIDADFLKPANDALAQEETTQ